VLRVALYSLFFLSGTAALAYEIVWQRQLVLVFGASTPAISAVLTAFMAGLALGSYLLGRRADRLGNPIATYGYVELGIGLSALAVPYLLAGADHVYSWVYQTQVLPYFWFNVVRFVLCAAVLLIPTTLMGATFPLMGRVITRSDETLGRETGYFYAVNTAGAVLGCVLAGYVLIPVIGMHHTAYLAVGINGFIALAAVLGLSPLAVGRKAAEVDISPAPTASASLTSAQRLLVLLFGVSGFLALGYQVVWTRLTAIYTTSNILAFTTVVAMFLVGIALGSVLYSLVLDRRRSWLVGVFALGEMVIGLYAVFLLYVLPRVGSWLADANLSGLLASRWQLTAGEVLLSMVLVFPPTLAMGVLLPVVVRLVADHHRTVGRQLGRVYAANTFGAILGSCVTGIVIIPSLGLTHADLLFAAGSILIGLVALAAMAKERALTVPIYAAAGVSALLVVGIHPPPARWLGPVQVRTRLDEHCVHYAVGDSATVNVGRCAYEGHLHYTLYVDSQGVASTYPAALCDAKMLAHLPLVLHPDPTRALTVGFGSGGTSYSMALHDVDVDCVEIEREVVNAAEHFEQNNHGVLDHPRLHVIIDDARNYLHLTPHRYSVISTDCTNLQYKSNGSLYTVDYFKLLKSRLTSDGIATAWIPGGNAPDDFMVLIRSFQTVFEHTSVWYVPTTMTNFFILIGTPEPLRIDLDQVVARMVDPAVAADLAEIDVTSPSDFLANFLAGPDSLKSLLSRFEVHTDDRPILEYRAARTFLAQTFPRNLGNLLALGDKVERYLDPDSIRRLAPGELRRLGRCCLAWRRAVWGHHYTQTCRFDQAMESYTAAADLLPGELLFSTFLKVSSARERLFDRAMVASSH